jgi:1,2-dihydroxy-3-keto-5-methylthiopentene dioxygenase
MAVLRLENGKKYTHLDDIRRELASLHIKLNIWSVGNDPEIRDLLGQKTLSEEEKELVLRELDNYFEELQEKYNYQSRDLIVLHPQTPNLDTILSKFERCHTHDDDEVRYIVDGEGVFGFVRPDGSQVELTVQAEEYINVPAGTPHWFHLTDYKRIKAIRYFSGTEGWIPNYTGTEIRFPTLVLT